MPRVLIADDNSNVQKMVSLALKDAGIEVVAVGNGEAAVRKMPEATPDLVLADIFMPVRNGYEVCEFVKRDPKYMHVPVILLVGAFDPLDEREALRVQADGVLKKPFVPPDPLISMVTSLLSKAAGERAVANPAQASAPGATKTAPAAAVKTAPSAPESSVEDLPEIEPPVIQRASQPEANVSEESAPLAYASLLEAAAPTTDVSDPIVTANRAPELGEPAFWAAKQAESEESAEDLTDGHAWEDALPRRSESGLLRSMDFEHLAGEAAETKEADAGFPGANLTPQTESAAESDTAGPEKIEQEFGSADELLEKSEAAVESAAAEDPALTEIQDVETEISSTIETAPVSESEPEHEWPSLEETPEAEDHAAAETSAGTEETETVADEPAQVEEIAAAAPVEAQAEAEAAPALDELVPGNEDVEPEPAKVELAKDEPATLETAEGEPSENNVVEGEKEPDLEAIEAESQTTEAGDTPPAVEGVTQVSEQRWEHAEPEHEDAAVAATPVDRNEAAVAEPQPEAAQASAEPAPKVDEPKVAAPVVEVSEKVAEKLGSVAPSLKPKAKPSIELVAVDEDFPRAVESWKPGGSRFSWARPEENQPAAPVAAASPETKAAPTEVAEPAPAGAARMSPVEFKTKEDAPEPVAAPVAVPASVSVPVIESLSDVTTVAQQQAAAEKATGDAYEQIVARVMERMQPQMIEAVTREILRPVVEALVRNELEKK